MINRLSHMTVVMIATLTLLGVITVQSDIISIDFDFTATLPTQSGTNTDANDQTSLPGQVGVWNSILLSGGAYNPDITDSYTSGTLKDGNGNDTSVSLVINPDGDPYWSAYKTSTSHLVQRDFIGNNGYSFVEWELSGLEPNTLYRLRMFGREDSNVPLSFSNFRAEGSTTNVASTYAKRNQADLWVTSSASGTISGTQGAAEWGGAGAWSGMQIEWDVEMPAEPPLISIDLGYADGTVWPGPVASWTQVDMNGHQSLPGQIGNWNELLTGNGATGGTTWNNHNDRPSIGGLLDGKGIATTVAFVFNTGLISYTTYANSPAQPKRTALHRDSVYITPAQGTANWQIAGLTGSTEYTLRLFGLQTANPALFAEFTATGLNTAYGTNTLLQNYTDLVVTSAVNGVITGTVKRTGAEAAGSLSGLQIQASGSGEPFPLASDLISLDFETAAPAYKTPTASGAITDSLGGTSFGQAGVWNSLTAGDPDGENWQTGNTTPVAIYDMFDGEGNTTTVDFHFNTGTPTQYYVFSLAGPLLGDMFGVLDNTPELSWQLTGLQPYAYYTIRMFGQVGSNYSTWEVSGAGKTTDSGTNSSVNNIVDLTVPATAEGEINGKLKWFGPTAGSSWTGMQILKLTDDPYKPAGTLIIIK